MPKSIKVSIFINFIKNDPWAVKDSCHVTLVDDDVETKAHRVILIALSAFIKNS